MPRRRKPRVLVLARAQVRETRHAVIGPAEPITNETSVVRQAATGAAFMAVAQSAALTAETASAYLRNITMLSQATIAVAMANMLKYPPVSVKQYQPVVEEVAKVLSSAVTSYTEISTAAAKVVREFPSS